MAFKDQPSWLKGGVHVLIIWIALSIIYLIYNIVAGGGKCSILFDTPALSKCFLISFSIFLIGAVPSLIVGFIIGYFFGAKNPNSTQNSKSWKILLVVGILLAAYGILSIFQAGDLIDLLYIAIGFIGIILSMILRMIKNKK